MKNLLRNPGKIMFLTLLLPMLIFNYTANAQLGSKAAQAIRTLKKAGNAIKDVTKELGKGTDTLRTIPPTDQNTISNKRNQELEKFIENPFDAARLQTTNLQTNLILTPRFSSPWFTGFTGAVPIQFSPDEQFLAGMDSTKLVIIEVATGKTVGHMQLPGVQQENYVQGVRIQFSKDGSQLAVMHPAHLFILTIADMKLTFVSHSPGHLNSVSPNFKYAVTGGQVWNLETQQLQFTFPNSLFEKMAGTLLMPRIFLGSIFTDKEEVLVATCNGEELMEINVLTGANRIIYNEVNSFTYPISYTADHKIVLRNFQMIDHLSGHLQPFPEPQDPHGMVLTERTGIMFYQDGNKFIANYGYQICIWERGASKASRCIPSPVSAIYAAVSSSGKKLFTVEHTGDFKIKDFEFPEINKKPDTSLVLKTFNASAYCFSRIAPVIYVGSTSGEIREINIETATVSDFVKLPATIYEMASFEDKGLFVRVSPEQYVDLGLSMDSRVNNSTLGIQEGYAAYTVRFSDKKVSFVEKFAKTDQSMKMMRNAHRSFDDKMYLTENNNVVQLNVSGKKEHCTLYFIADSPKDYLVIHSDGRFDGTDAGLSLLMSFKSGKQVKSDLKKDPQFTPGLLNSYTAEYIKTFKDGQNANAVAAGHSSQGTLYTVSREYNGSLSTRVFDIATGTSKMNPKLEATLLKTFGDNHALLQQRFPEGVLELIDLSSGNVQRTVKVEGRISMATKIKETIYCLYQNPANAAEHFLTSIDAGSGTAKWKQIVNYTTTPAIESGSSVLLYESGKGLQVLDNESGAKKWRYDVPNLRSTAMKPLVANGMVFLKTYSKNIIALDLATGSVRYEIKFGSEFSGQPTISEQLIFLGSSAYDIKTGNIVWQTTDRSNLETVLAGNILVAQTSRELAGFDSKSGMQKWKVPFVHNNSMMLLSNGLILCKENKAGFLNGSDVLVGIDVNTGDRKWEINIGIPNYSQAQSFTLANGIVYVSSTDQLHAIDISNGGKIWSQFIKLPNMDFYVLSQNGKAYLPVFK